VPPLWPWILAGLWLAMVLAVLLTGAGLWLYRRWQNRAVSATLGLAPVIDTRPPEVIAHAELDRIESLALPAQQRIKEHYILVSNCMRQYVEGRYQIPALEQTSGELRAAFRRAGIPMREMNAFMRLFSESDLVKFARYVPAANEIDRLINKARIIIDATIPVPEMETPSESEMEVTA